MWNSLRHGLLQICTRIQIWRKTVKKLFLSKICHRLAVENVTQSDSEAHHTRSIAKNPNMQKLILLSFSLHIACKINKYLRAMKRMCVASGLDVKHIRQYEHLTVSNIIQWSLRMMCTYLKGGWNWNIYKLKKIIKNLKSYE